jgi:hypothetical protein
MIAVAQIRHVEMLTLRLAADAGHDAVAELTGHSQGVREIAQEGTATVRGNRLCGAHHSVQLLVAQFERHGRSSIEGLANH